MFCHSLTARSVPRQFREGLKKGMPQRTDRNIKVWQDHPHDGSLVTAATATATATATPSPEQSMSDRPRRRRVDTSMLHIVYDSERSDVVPYPDAEYVRTPSPEHSGIPAKPASIRGGNRGRRDAYSSDDSSLVTPERTRKLPPALRRKAKATAAVISCT